EEMPCYSICFHIDCTAVFTTWAVLRLRTVALAQANRTARLKKPKGVLRELTPRRPRIGRYPMLWKEIYAEPGLRLNWPGRILVAVLVVMSFVPAGWIVYDYLFPTGGAMGRSSFYEGINIWVRMAGTMVACLLLLQIAVRASGSVTGEHDRQTMDSLLTSPLGSDAMFFAKWWGS